MFVKMIGLYGNEKFTAYFRENGDCFDFVTQKKFATDLTKEKANEVLKHENWYCKCFGAMRMIVEQ